MDNDTHQETEVEISDYNSDSFKRRANISYSGNQLNIDADKLYVTKYKITSSNFPVWIPNIVNTPDTFNPPNATVQANTAADSKDWNTDIAICVLNKSTNKYCNVPVTYNKVDSYFPLNEPAHGSVPSRNDVLNNDFFYTFTSIKLLSKIEKAVITALTELGASTTGAAFMAIRNESQYQFLLNESLGADYNIYVNSVFRRMFNLDYTINQNNSNWYQINYNASIQFPINDVNYYSASTISFTTRIYPFSNIIFSGNVQTKQINRISGPNQTTPVAISEIFSYYLTITDVDAIAGTIQFQADSFFKGKSLNDIVNSIKIDIYFKTPDGYYVPFILYPGDYATIELEFI